MTCSLNACKKQNERGEPSINSCNPSRSTSSTRTVASSALACVSVHIGNSGSVAAMPVFIGAGSPWERASADVKALVPIVVFGLPSPWLSESSMGMALG